MFARSSKRSSTYFGRSLHEIRSKFARSFFCEVRFEMHGNIFSVPTVRQTKDRLLPTPWRILRGNRATSGGWRPQGNKSRSSQVLEMLWRNRNHSAKAGERKEGQVLSQSWRDGRGRGDNERRVEARSAKKRHSGLCQDRCGVEEEAFLTPVILMKYRSKSKNGSVVRSVLGPYLEKRYGRKTSTFLLLVPYVCLVWKLGIYLSCL